MTDFEWYKNIEDPVRDIVKLLRNNGFNTTCSCGHKMYIEGSISIDGDIQRLHNILYNYYCEIKEKPSYEIIFTVKVEDGYITYKNFYVELKKK